MAYSYGKLVRDKIPEIIKNNGEEPITRILDFDEYKKELEMKLLEECHEVLESQSKERLEELADLIEVVKALVKLEDATLEDVFKIAEQKKEKRGAFEKRIYLDSVITKE